MQLDVSAADIDDENVAFHRTLPAGELLADPSTEQDV